MKNNPLLGLVAASAALVIAASAPRVAAQTTEDKAAAEALFEAARGLMSSGKYADACSKLEASERLDAGVGTLLYLGECYEKAGRLASAWATFREGESIANGRGDKSRAQIARAHAAALEPRLSKLSLTVANGNSATVVVKRDGNSIPRASWGLALPTDPGAHTIEASSPGRKTWTGTVTVQGEGTTTAFQIPLLDELPPEAPATTAPTSPPVAAPLAATEPLPAADTEQRSSGNAQRVVGIVVGSVGIVGLGVGTYFGIHAKNQNTDSINQCDPTNPNLCPQAGVNLRNDARTNANVATALLIGGGAFLATGVILYLIAPSNHSSGTASRELGLTAMALPGRSGVSLEGTW